MAAVLAVAISFNSQGAQKTLSPELEARLIRFFKVKEAQAQALIKQENKEGAPDMWDFFKAGKEGDWKAVASLYRGLARRAYQYEGTQNDKQLETMAWQPLNECFGAYDQFINWPEDYVEMFGHEILGSIPPGSIYFGGTDPGRWVVTAFCKSHTKADPCFVLTQNALADGLYLKYLGRMYGGRIKTPSEADSKKAYDAYIAEASQRDKEGKLKAGENVKNVNGKYQVSGQVAVMAVSANIARMVFDSNPDREFFIEESFPLDWMYPYLSPNGFIMKINRKPPGELAAEIVRKDRDHWMWFIDRAVGQWLTPETPLKDVCEFAAKVFGARESGDYQADDRFVRNGSASKTYSKLRSSIAQVYVWHWKNSKSPDDKKRMAKEADFAFRQAFALCPYSPEVVSRYVNLLKEQGRKTDALLVAQTAEPLDPRNRQFSKLIQQLEEE